MRSGAQRTACGCSLANCGVRRHSTAIGGLWSLPHRCAGVLPISAVDGGFHVRMDAPAALARSFHLGTFTPITRSHRYGDPSPRKPEARL